MSTSGGVWKSLERGASIGCEIVQIFVKSNMRWFGALHMPADVAKFKEQCRVREFSAVFGHTGYLINVASPAGSNRDNSLKSLTQEIGFATALGLPFLVMHPGAHMGAGEKEGIRRAIAGLNEVFDATRMSQVRIALENTAGQGTCFGYRLEHLAAIYDGVKDSKRLALCLDTCHFFAAGYDIRTRKGWDGALKEVDRLIGLKQVVAFHLNDSKTELGSRVDRHEHIGKGRIGLEGFRHIVNDPRLRKCPGCLETPKSDDLHEDIENLATLRSLVKG